MSHGHIPAGKAEEIVCDTFDLNYGVLISTTGAVLPNLDSTDTTRSIR